LKSETFKIEEDKLTLFVSYEEELDFLVSSEIENIAKLKVDYDLLYNGTIELGFLSKFNNLEELVIRIKPMEEYHERPNEIWPTIFAGFGSYHEDDQWNDVVDYLGSCIKPVSINFERLIKCKKLKRLAIMGDRIEIESFKNIAKCKKLEVLRLHDIYLVEVEDEEISILKTSNVKKIQISGTNMEGEEEILGSLTEKEVAKVKESDVFN